MPTNQQIIDALKEELLQLKRKHVSFYHEIKNLEQKIEKLEQAGTVKEPVADIVKKPVEKEIVKEEVLQPKPVLAPEKTQPIDTPKKPEKEKVNMESFIGENLVAKIGVLITVIGVAIGGKYAIDNDLISPLTRIILGYVLGIGLAVFALKLKEKYKNFSAVLLSGAMAIFYFITYFAHTLYGLIPQTLAFALMLLFTCFTVISAIHYKKQVIAVIGLVGAYAIPFFLSNDSGNALVLFSYMAIINMGILVVAYKQYWKVLYILAFSFTWIIYLAWFFDSYYTDGYFITGLSFSTIFFLIFYVTFLAYKLIKKEDFNYGDVILLLFNSFIYYGIGYNILSDHETGMHLLGIFTVFNALIHFIAGVLIYKTAHEKKTLFYTVFGLVIVFLTIAVPVQLDGHWVTLLWIGEAALLYWIGTTKNINMYRSMTYVLLVIASFSLFYDWSENYTTYNYDYIPPIFNIQFLTSLIFIGALAFINYVYYKYAPNKKDITGILFGLLLTGITYMAFQLEITNYFNKLDIDYNTNVLKSDNYFPDYYQDYEVIWNLNYLLFFLSVFSVLNMKKFKIEVLGNVNIVVNACLMIYSLAWGLFVLSQIRENYLYNNGIETLFPLTGNAILIRYIFLFFAVLLLYCCYLYTKQDYINDAFKKNFKLFLAFVLLWILSSELLHWLDFAGNEAQYKLSLSIFWGIYALALIVYGIWKRDKLMRIAGIVVFGVTLVKLFFYDIAHLSTISKTIVFIALGLLLLVISFLYNKYTSIISQDDKK